MRNGKLYHIHYPCGSHSLVLVKNSNLMGGKLDQMGCGMHIFLVPLASEFRSSLLAYLYVNPIRCQTLSFCLFFQVEPPLPPPVDNYEHSLSPHRDTSLSPSVSLHYQTSPPVSLCHDICSNKMSFAYCDKTFSFACSDETFSFTCSDETFSFACFDEMF